MRTWTDAFVFYVCNILVQDWIELQQTLNRVKIRTKNKQTKKRSLERIGYQTEKLNKKKVFIKNTTYKYL